MTGDTTPANTTTAGHDWRRIAWGIAIIAFGLLLMADAAAFREFDFSGRFWPFILIGLGAVKLAQAPDPTSRRPHGSGAWLLFVGLWGLATELHLAGLTYRTSWPLLVIGAGVALVYGALSGKTACSRRRGRQHVA